MNGDRTALSTDHESDHKRLDLIIKTLRECGEPVTRETVSKQFRYETGAEPCPTLMGRRRWDS